MQCHAAEALASAPSADAPPSSAALAALWNEPAPLRFHPVSGRVEALTVEAGGSGDAIESPLEPPSANSKGRDVSFQTLLVRRAVSFIFDDATGSSPLATREGGAGGGSTGGLEPRLASPHAMQASSPHTAIAA